jgi:hypothetical protein
MPWQLPARHGVMIRGLAPTGKLESPFKVVKDHQSRALSGPVSGHLEWETCLGNLFLQSRDGVVTIKRFQAACSVGALRLGAVEFNLRVM